MTDETAHIQKYPVDRPSGEVRADEIVRLVRENMAEELAEAVEDIYWGESKPLTAEESRSFEAVWKKWQPAEAATDAPNDD